jgi:hypothetical protein
MKKTGTIIAIVVLALAGAFLGIRRAVLGPQKYWADFVGVPEAEIGERLGSPRYDSRLDKDVPKEENIFVWGYGHGDQFTLSLTFSNGVVVSQSRGSH